MYVDRENVFYYLTIANEPYVMPPMPEGAREGILRGMYRFRASSRKDAAHRVQLLGSGSILNEVIAAADLLEKRYGVAADVWSVTSYKELFRNAATVERWNTLHPGEPPRAPYVRECLGEAPGIVVAASDYTKALPYSIARWIPGRFAALGTDGFGRSEGREALRDFFEVDAKHIVLAALAELVRAGRMDAAVAAGAIADLGIDPEKPNPMFA
jgi:pyruvate dehydrogenase E1 component